LPAKVDLAKRGIGFMKENRMGLFSGVGMVIANMIGAGVFLSTGFMAQELSPKYIMLAWGVGALLALAGARAYAGIAQMVPSSGGEYRYLSTLMHPVLGYLAGWASLLLGFSAPIAIDAIAAGAFAKTLIGWINPKFFATLLIMLLTILHAIRLRLSVTTQNILVVIKIALVLSFVIVGLSIGHNAWPKWQPPIQSSGFPLGPFMQNLFYIAFAFSGWNAAIYAASEFKNPKRDVPRAMLLGCALVGLIYIFVNWVFIANLTPEQCKVVFDYETARITLGHLIMKNLIGDFGAACMSVLAIIAFISAVSAMTFLGPRVYSAMSKDGFLPRSLQGIEGKPPVWAVVLQGVIALFLVFAYQLQEVLNNVGAILTLFSALTVFSLFWVRIRKKQSSQPDFSALAAGLFYLLLAGLMLYFGFKRSPSLNLWVAACILTALIGYFITKQDQLQRPEKVGTAVKLLCVALGFFILQNMMDPSITAAALTGSRLLIPLLIIAVWCLFIYMIGKGYNWARIAFFIIGIPLRIVQMSSFSMWSLNSITKPLFACEVILLIISLILLFQKSSSAWFKFGRTTASSPEY
jgi:amino acid transporter